MDLLAESPQEAKEFEALMSGAEPPAPEPTPEPKVETPPAADPPKAEAETPPPKPEAEKPVRLVPHQALHEEREKRKQLEQRLAVLERAQPQPQPIGDEEPDEHTDPIGTIAWLKAQRAKEQEERQTTQQQQAYLQDLGQKVQARVNAYAAEHPEYKEQVTFLREFRFRELVEGLGYSPEVAAAQVQNEEISIGKMAVDQDLDPGEIVAKLASVRGWKAKEPEPQPAPEKPKPAPEAEAKVDRIARGQRAAISPSSAGGGGPEPEMTLEQLLDLQGAAFDAAFAKHGQRLLGG